MHSCNLQLVVLKGGDFDVRAEEWVLRNTHLFFVCLVF